MPTLRPDSIFSEFAFTQPELNAARTLSHAQICLYQTMYAQLSKQKLSTPLPDDINLDRDYLMKMAELDGKMAVIQELLDNHQAALKDISNPANGSEAAGMDVSELSTIADRAAQLVNRQSE